MTKVFVPSLIGLLMISSSTATMPSQPAGRYKSAIEARQRALRSPERGFIAPSLRPSLCAAARFGGGVSVCNRCAVTEVRLRNHQEGFGLGRLSELATCALRVIVIC